MVVEVLRAARYDVDEATDGADALDSLDRRLYALVVSDVAMKGLDGPGLYREMRRRLPIPPQITFVTGESSQGAYATFLAEVEVPVIAKSFRPSTIITAVRTALDDA